MEQKFLQSERCVCDLKIALDKKEREATASAQKLQDQLLAHVETVKRLEERVQRLEIEKTSLEGTVQQQSDRIEALQRDLQATAPAQAASQDRLEHTRARHQDSESNQLKDRALKCTLDKLKNAQPESTFLRESTQAEVEHYKELYLQEKKNRKFIAKKLERLEKVVMTDGKKRRVIEKKEEDSELEEMKNFYAEITHEVGRLRTKVRALSHKLDMDSRRSMQLEAKKLGFVRTAVYPAWEP
ncbi:coiled-coil domain-containing protein 186-like [Corvus cornix cornix]|uniref:coiled-coil domain-containing protein 186-like n=1 Tax=Corvus cornix cornix TaxID=932674 RepID=UPI00194F6FA5|nr:coiled-coil domain-containing protein 186-like [Corvus cornix cornix]